jgi:competence protein ComEA
MHSTSPTLTSLGKGELRSERWQGASRARGQSALARALGILGPILVLSLTTSCSNSQPPSNQQVEQKAAQATEKAKQDSKEALADARSAAANAEGTVNAIASGVKQGIHGNVAAAPASRVDLNTASESDLAALPGISNEKARQIIKRRPYTSAHQLVGRGLLSQPQFEQIAPDVTVR